MFMRLAALVLPLLLPGCFRVVKPRAPQTERPAPGAFPHGLLTAALRGHVTPEGLVDYKALQTDREELDAFLGFVALVSPESNPELFPTRWDELAYYINAYNGLAIGGVLDRPGLNSVIDHKVDFFYYTRYRIGGRKLDLYRLENGVVRPTYDDPRIHFALNCQSIGCPRLPQEAFPVDGLDAYLDEMSEEFVTHPDKVRVDDDGTVHVSELFSWYAEDFEATGGPVGFVAKYRDDVEPDAPRGDDITYDWSLIAQPGKGP